MRTCHQRPGRLAECLLFYYVFQHYYIHAISRRSPYAYCNGPPTMPISCNYDKCQCHHDAGEFAQEVDDTPPGVDTAYGPRGHYFRRRLVLFTRRDDACFHLVPCRCRPPRLREWRRLTRVARSQCASPRLSRRLHGRAGRVSGRRRMQVAEGRPSAQRCQRPAYFIE